jgi:hypothetical protein
MRPDSFALAEVDGQFQLQCLPDCDPRPERWQFHLSSPRPDLRMALAIGDRAITRFTTLAVLPPAGRFCGWIEERPVCEPA